MRVSFSNIQRLVAGVFISGAMLGCGSASNNDQGVSFSLLGYFSELPATDDTTLPTQLTGLSMTLSDPSDESPPSGSNFGSGTVIAVVGIQNNLVAQFMRTDQIFFEYNVPGAAAQPPSTNYPLSITLGAADSSSVTPPNSTLPGGFADVSNRGFAQVTVIPAEIRQWLTLNRDLLPSRPFVMAVRTTVTGVTSAGDRLDTNPADLIVQVADDTVVTPTVDEGD